METEAIDNQANLVNYDNENEYEIEDLGYESEEYTEDAHKDDENNHSNGYAKRGINRLCKYRREYGKPGVVKLMRHGSEHIGFARFYPGRRKAVMIRLGYILRSFRRKLRQTYILPNQDIPLKLNEVPTKYSVILKAKDWVNFVNYMATEEYKKETEDKIKEGTLQVDQGTDSMTLVLGKEKGGYARGVGSGVTYKRYFDLPRSKQAADERILLLESQLDAARREREEKELLIKSAPREIHPINSSADERGREQLLL
ncbi:hypothetical protein Tco_0677035 [Tanacetum coccineum]